MATARTPSRPGGTPPRDGSPLTATGNAAAAGSAATTGSAAATGSAATAGSAAAVDRHRGFRCNELVDDLRTALVSRALDDREIILQKQSRVFFQISGAGHEVLLLALARSLRPGYDWFFPYYRDRALVLGLGVTPLAILLQAVGSAADPASGGRQMPCHWGDPERNIVTQSSPTGSQCLPAVGCAEAGRYIARRSRSASGRGLDGCGAQGDEVIYVSLGEGATAEGELWESLITACRLHLPVLFVVADNRYAISVRSSGQLPGPIAEMVRGFRGLAVTRIDGCDYYEARSLGAKAIARVRAGEGPGLIHANVTRPYSHSSADTQSKYRSAGDLASEAAHDPIARFAADLVTAGILTTDDVAAMGSKAAELVATTTIEALDAPRPDPATVTQHVANLAAVTAPARPTPAPARPTPAPAHPTPAPAHPTPAPAHPTPESAKSEEATAWPRVAAAPAEPGPEPALARSGETVMLGEAIRSTLFSLMEADERIRVFGEDVADADDNVLAEVEGKGGVFGTTKGLQRRFGTARCYNTPLAEANIVGRAIGQALRGLRPAPEIQFFDYIWPAMQQLRSEAATIRWRSNGKFTCPMVVRVPIGGYLTGGAIWHSQCGESIFAHVPGLLIAFPSTAEDAAGLLRTAFGAEDPVLFLEHKHLLRHRGAAGTMPGTDHAVPFGLGRIAREGHDCTVVTWGATVHLSIAAGETLATENIATEVIDLRTIAPWDRDIVAESVERTSRLIVVHEDTLTCGFGAEVAAWASEHCFASLDAPVTRLGATDTPVAYEPALEHAILPQIADIVAAVRQVVRF